MITRQWRDTNGSVKNASIDGGQLMPNRVELASGSFGRRRTYSLIFARFN